MKKCRECGEEKPTEAFSKERAVCKVCRSAAQRLKYPEIRERCIENATRWAKANPDRKREINKASNIRTHGVASVQPIDSDECKFAFEEFMIDFDRCHSDDERYALCYNFIDTPYAAVFSLPDEIEAILQAWEDCQFGENENKRPARVKPD